MDETRRRRILLLVAGALLIIVWALQVNPYLSVAGDAGRYMVLGESLARTGDLRLLNEIRHPLDTLYPPGFPAIIAGWMLVTGRGPDGVVLLVKVTQLLFMLAMLPLLMRLLERARLSFPFVAAGVLMAALSPATGAYANEVMSEAPFLLLTLASVALIERPRPAEHREEEEAEPNPPIEAPPGRRVLSLACAAGAFLVRSSGLALLIVLIPWMWRRYGRIWGGLALLTALIVVGGWQLRNRHIVRHHPEVHYSSYIDQFTLRDPNREGAGRIQLNPAGILLRAHDQFPTYIGMIPRSILHTMAPNGSAWLIIFYLLAIPMTLLLFWGFVVGWKRGLTLCGSLYALFWLFAALWPWKDARFLVPLLPFTVLYICAGAEALFAGKGRAAAATLAALLLVYNLRVDAIMIPRERAATRPGYALGRTKAEAGFYAACAWLSANTPQNALVMGRPAYLLHLYSHRSVTQIEPTSNPRAQEKAYMAPLHVAYLVQDKWDWSKTDTYLNPYMAAYGNLWTLAWQDPQGSGVRIWHRNPPIPARPSAP